MYNGPDQSWRELPRFIDPDVLKAAADDISVYSAMKGLESVSVVLHGGEPSLLPNAALSELVHIFETRLRQDKISLRLCVQTNSFSVSDETIKAWLSHGVDIGVSIDLSQQSHDVFRLTKSGTGSYEKCRAGIQRMRYLSGGTQPVSGLAVIDPSVSPETAWGHLQDLNLPYYDVLLPDHNWLSPPVLGVLPYKQWLQEFWKLYTTKDRKFQVRWFNTVLKLLQGGIWGSDSLGLHSAGTLILETDGRYVFHDALRTAEYQINQTGFYVGSHSIEAIENLPTMQMMMRKSDFLPTDCRKCRHSNVCGGGHVVHRYSAEAGLANPSVYCDALLALYDDAQFTLRSV